MGRDWRLVLLLLGIIAMPGRAISETPLNVSFEPQQSGFVLVRGGRAATLVSDRDDSPVVTHAVGDLADDIAGVAGIRPQVVTSRPMRSTEPVVLVGTLGHSAPIDALVRSGKLDVAKLKGGWESFLIATVEEANGGQGSILAIVGSDRRGTAYGVYELSEAIGQSPWHWWADVPARHHDTIIIPSGQQHFGPPSVKYRGIFINDEDWGLQPWAAKTFEPAAGDIGPRTYERVFQLLLRLKANTLWPAMHKVSAPFNADPANAALADKYAIVMGSSHAEPMLRDNVGEWKGDPSSFNYATNRKGVLDYWEKRVRSNAHYESLWTLGMRGIHDSRMVGPPDTGSKVALLNQVIGDQRGLLGRYVGHDVRSIPQIFVPYKEVLDLYRSGLKIPDDVTLVWPDDNFGYLRYFPDATEQARSGGSGIYYHLSYLGAPLSYIWLSTTPPALIEEETRRAYNAGARRVWIANVGDIKPAETDISFFFEQAWDIDRWHDRSQREFLDDWSGRTFGDNVGHAIGGVLDAYYRLNFERRPEHLQWWLPGEKPRDSGWSEERIAHRLREFAQTVTALPPIEAALSPGQKDAFFELVAYPVRAAAAANVRYFEAEKYKRLIDHEPAAARAAGADAVAADHEIKMLTRRFNDEVAGGKWRYIMAEEPADNQWPQFRISPVTLPSAGLVSASSSDAGGGSAESLSSGADDEALTPARIDGWRWLEGLGSGAFLATRAGALLSYHVRLDKPVDDIVMECLPSFGTATPESLEFRISIDGRLRIVRVARDAERGDWAAGVLNNRLAVALGTRLAAGDHTIEIQALDAGTGISAIHFRHGAQP